MTTLVIGADISKEKVDVALITLEQKAPTDLDNFANNQAGFKKLAKQVEDYAEKQQVQTILLVMEPSGGYEQPLAYFALQKGWRVSMPNPYKVRQWAKGTQGRAKTDRLDARVLARYGKSESVLDWKPLPDRLKQLDELLKRQESLKETLHQENNRLQALESQGITSGDAVESIQRSISWLKEELKLLSDNLDRFLEDHPDLKEQVRKLKTVPGVGPRNSLFLLILLHRWSILTNGKGEHKGLVAYVGLDPVPYESGKSVRKHCGISRQGNAKIRANLYMGAMANLRGNNPLTAFYQRLVGKGKLKKIALVAATRKILVWAWGVFREGNVFEPKLAAPRTK